MPGNAELTPARRLRILAWAMLAAAVLVVVVGVIGANMLGDDGMLVLGACAAVALVDLGLFVWLRRRAARLG